MGRHEIDGLDRAQGDHVLVAALIAHDTDRAHRQKHRERLTGALIELMAAQFLDEDMVGTAQQLRVLGGHFAEYAHAESGTGERVAVHQLVWQAELEADAPNFVLEEFA